MGASVGVCRWYSDSRRPRQYLTFPATITWRSVSNPPLPRGVLFSSCFCTRCRDVQTTRWSYRTLAYRCIVDLAHDVDTTRRGYKPGARLSMVRCQSAAESAVGWPARVRSLYKYPS